MGPMLPLLAPQLKATQNTRNPFWHIIKSEPQNEIHLKVLSFKLTDSAWVVERNHRTVILCALDSGRDKFCNVPILSIAKNEQMIKDLCLWRREDASDATRDSLAEHERNADANAHPIHYGLGTVNYHGQDYDITLSLNHCKD